MSDLDRPGLRRALRAAYPWLDAADAGPRAVDAGECDRCGDSPRLVPTCGPVPWQALCPRCARTVGANAWCDGHAAEGRARLDWAASLPHEWATVVRLWWVATGEARLEQLVAPPQTSTLPAGVRAALPER